MMRRLISSLLFAQAFSLCAATSVWAAPPSLPRAGAAGSMSALPAPAVASNALPTNGQVVAGQATISQKGNTMTVKQTSDRAVVNWNSFDVGSNARVNIQQPSNTSATLNRVTGASASQIEGAINANGRVVISNANGVTFGKGAQVDAAAVVATTMNQSDQDFMDGKNTWTGNGKGAVINKGTIRVNDVDGYVALLAPEVRNEGYVLATKSRNNAVVMAGGEQITLNFQGQQLVGVNVDKGAYDALIENQRVVETRGGLIVLAAGTANQLMRSVVRNTGRLTASSMVNNGGVIELVGNNVVNTGKVAVNTKAADATAGRVTVTANTVTQAGKVSADGKGARSNGGRVTIAAEDVTLATGSTTTAKGRANGGLVNVGTTEVTYNADANGVRSNIIARNLAQTVNVQVGATVDVSSTERGNGGEINIWSTRQTTVAGTLIATGGRFGGNGGSIETSAVGVLSILQTANVNVAAPAGRAGSWMLDPENLVVDASLANAISSALGSANVTVAVSGNLTIAEGVSISSSSSSGTTLTLLATDTITNNGSVSTSALNISSASVNLAAGC
jgi:filamentous hemagglutinin family protein